GTFDHNYNWWDPSDICSTPQPCDNIEHGTHTMGTMVGGDGLGPFTPDIGVAPDAQWIAAKGCEFNSCSEFALMSAGQWILAPTDLDGANPDPDRRPHIVNNSWGSGPGDPFYQDVVRAWRAAGIIPVFASGNPGSSCGAGGSPGDFLEAFSVGATDINDTIAFFSGRGPSIYGKVNPDVSAPGVDVTSSVPGGGYAAFNGTSMATPHASGAFALMLSAEPELLRQLEPAEDALRSTALDIIDTSCGGDADGDPNNVYGEGRIDAMEAVSLVASSGVLEGTVTAGPGGSAIAGAEVTATSGAREASTVTEAQGTYHFSLIAGTYTLEVSAFGYESQTFTVEVITDQAVVQDVALVALPTFAVTGKVTSAENGPRVPLATVSAVGTPAFTTTDRQGRYTLNLPAGTYTLEATVGGCTNPGTASIVVGAAVRQDLQLTRKIDDFGHGCRAIQAKWFDAHNRTALFGDDVYGRLELPFAFPFYGESYSAVYVASNGFLSFTDPQVAEPNPGPIPSAERPNAAIYPLWTNLVVDEEAHIDYQARRDSFVVEFSNLATVGGLERVDFEVKLWSDGRIDTLYRNNTGRPGDGSTAAVGLENADGTDALQFGLEQPLIRPGAAFRYETIGTGVVSGVVTNANDAEAIEGATVTAQPGGRRAVTGADGSYSLRLVSGSYQLTASTDGYEALTSPLTLGSDETPELDFALPAPSATVTPATVEATTPVGVPTTQTVTVTNDGTVPLTFEAEERDTTPLASASPAASASAVADSVPRPATWEPFDPSGGAGLPAPVEPTAEIPLEPIIDDPDDDAFSNVEITQVLGGSDGTSAMEVAMDFSASTPVTGVVGYVFFDTDQNPATGIPPEFLFGKSTQDVGIDYYADLFNAPFGVVNIYDQFSAFQGSVTPVAVGQQLSFQVPLSMLGSDDGAIDVAMVLGNQSQPTDWAPDVGKGSIDPVREAPWMTVDPMSGTVAPGESFAVALTLGGEGFAAGQYTAQVVFTTNDPRQPVHIVEVTLDVEAPPPTASAGASAGPT
ncbi:MAG: carboxypeptidase regulatory-like domain-containing protein, partial [Acidimicrobiales bacterium]